VRYTPTPEKASSKIEKEDEMQKNVECRAGNL